MKISLSLTHDCNLRCKYCYAGDKFHKTMDLDTAKKIIDFAYDITPKQDSIDFSLFGGEPFLCFSLIKNIISYIESKNFPNVVTYNITTNGTIINDEIINYIRKKDIKVAISIDGAKEIHDKNRVDIHGNGTLDVVLENIKKLSSKVGFFQVNAVYGSQTITQLDKTFEFFVENGIKNIHLNPDITEKWDISSFPDISTAYERIADKYIELYKANNEVALNLIDNKLILFFKGGYEEADKCSMGQKEFGFAPSGNVYPCERLIGNDSDEEMCMGNIHTGINPLKRCSIAQKTGNSNKECINCPVQNYCMNWCGCTNYNMTGYSDKVSAMLCYSEQVAITVAKKVFSALKENETFLDHFLNYLTHQKILEKEVYYENR